MNNSLFDKIEYDIFIKEKKIAIEYNGLYWHKEGKKDKFYHLKKSQLAQQENIRLIQIFEDEYIFKKEIVVSRLKSLLGTPDRRIYARKCSVKEINSKEKDSFLNKNHIQGTDKSKVKLGLFFENELVSVMTFGHPRLALGSKKNNRQIWELVRFASTLNTQVVGGAGKLLKYFERNYKPDEIFSYSDKRWSDGGLYKALGFEYSHTSRPNYWYFDEKEMKRYHRFNFRKDVLNEKLEFFDPKLTEIENMMINGYSRIWDCGNDKWIKKYE